MTRSVIVAAVVIVALFFLFQPQAGNEAEGLPPHATTDQRGRACKHQPTQKALECSRGHTSDPPETYQRTE